MNVLACIWAFYYICIYAFSRRFYPKRLTVYSGYTLFISMCSLGIEPTTFALLMQCSTAEPQEHYYTNQDLQILLDFLITLKIYTH